MKNMKIVMEIHENNEIPFCKYFSGYVGGFGASPSDEKAKDCWQLNLKLVSRELQTNPIINWNLEKLWQLESF